MKIHKLAKFTKGWFIGDFDPSIHKTKGFEVAVKFYQSGDKESLHFHKIAQEYTIIVDGRFEINGKVYKKGDIIHFQPNDISDFKCIESGSTTVVKIPSVANDKYEVKGKHEK